MQCNILAEDHVPRIKNKFVLKLTKDVNEANESAQVLHFGSNWSNEEVLQAVDALNLHEYPNIFVIIIESQNFDIFERIKTRLTQFEAERQLILQITSLTENISKFYYKHKSSNQFNVVDPQTEIKQNVKKFESIFWSFLISQNDSSYYIASAWMDIIKFPLLIKFLKLFENLFVQLILEVTKSGTKTDLLKLFEAPVNNEGRILSIEAQYYLSEVFPDNKSASDLDDDSEYEKLSSVLLTAIEYKKTEIVDLLITYWTHLVQQLPINHQVQISTAAYNTEQLNILCDLIDIADFPFPEDFEIDDGKRHERFHKITSERVNLERAIKKANFDKINKFIDSHLNHKYVFSIDNDTALTQAIEAKKYDVFYYLKSLSFQGENIPDDLSKEDKKKASEQAVKARKANIKLGLVDVHKSVLLLASRSIIHNRRISMEQETEYREKITNWLKDIHKIASEMLDVAASCENLKIIFDFESETVDNIDLESTDSLGLTRRNSKWIFVGAKLLDKPREQQIKGVLAHELCHYVMCLVYNNKFLPYFEDDKNVCEKFEEIVKAIDKWSGNYVECPDDECNGNIMTVFTCYDPKQFPSELIVRPVQNQVEFDNNVEKTKKLEMKYKILIDFWQENVVPDLQNFSRRNPKIIKLNKLVKLLPKILRKEIKMKSNKKIEAIVENKVSLIKTNVPTLLFINIVTILKEKFGTLMDSQNFFTEPQKLNNEEVFNDFVEVCKDIEKLNIFVDCTKAVPDYLNGIFVNKDLTYIFVVSNEEQCEKLMKVINRNNKRNVQKIEINYEWNDLTEESQKTLLKNKKINFQNNSQIKMAELLETEKVPEIIDDELLNLIMNDEEILINSVNELNLNEKEFEVLNIKRVFVKKIRNQYRISGNNRKSKIKQEKISHDDMLDEIKSNKFVLISDMAGDGKSWALKNFTKILREKNSTSWVTYVDLKQFITKFKEQAAQQDRPEFSIFMCDKILNLKQEFESKVFQKLYKDGKVFIFFDGFDEIAPDCAEFVSNLAYSFEQNGGNQLWIATRDYFEVDLMKKLEIDVAYGLDEMSSLDGIKMIAKIWILMNLGDKIESMTVNEVNKYIKTSLDYEKFKQKAKQIVKKLKTGDIFSSVGMPQIFKMIADGFRNEQNLHYLTRSKIYDQFSKSLYKKWTQEKGKIREEASIESQRQQFNFWRFHQFHAIKRKFPDLVNILFPGYDGKDLPIEELIGCGILSIKNGEIYFLHETLREYFVADAMAKVLTNEEIDEKILETFVDILTLKQNKVIRMFLNDSIESITLQKIQPKMKKFQENFNELKIFSEYFRENVDNLVDFVILILADGEFKKIKTILVKNVSNISKCAQSSEMFLKFQNFLYQFLNSEDLKNCIKSKNVLKNIIQNQNLGFDVLTDFVLKIESKTGFDFVQEELRDVISDKWIYDSKFDFIFNVRDQKALKFNKFMKMLQNFLSTNHIQEFLKKKDNHNENILLICVERNNEEYLEIIWTNIENYFTMHKISHEFKELVKQQHNKKENILHKVAIYESLELHEILWKLLLNTIMDREELKNFVLQKDKYGNNFIHKLVSWNKNLNVIKCSLNILMKNFENFQFQEILQSRGNDNQNLLHGIVFGGHGIELFKTLWQEFCSLCKSEQEFWKIIKEVDEHERNILNYATWKSSIEVNDFLFGELEKNCSKEEIKEILTNSDKWNRSLLHSAAVNKFTDVFKAVWKNYQEYLTKEEILKIVKQVGGYYDENFLFKVNSNETFELVIEELEKIVKNDDIKDMLSSSNKQKQNILQKAATWPKKTLKFYKSLWKIFGNYFDKLEILNLIKNIDEDGNNLLHIAVEWGIDTTEIIEFTWNEIKSYLSHDQQIEYLRMRGKDEKNLIDLCKYSNENKKWIENLIKMYEIE